VDESHCPLLDQSGYSNMSHLMLLLGGKADMGCCAAYARFWTKADIDFFMQTFCVTDLP